MVLAAVTIGVGMQIVGILLVAALMVLPVGIARNLVRSFRSTVLGSAAAGATAALAGLLLANALDSAPSGTIVLVAVGGYMASDVARRMRDAASRRRAAHA